MGFRTKYLMSAYPVSLEGLRSDGEPLYLKFDTGAMNTVISFHALSDSVDAKEKLKTYCIENNIREREFKSASGHKMHGYHVVATDIFISGYRMKRLYYYLLMDVDNNVALLGDDFISNCRFSHEPKRGIVVSDVMLNEYVNLSETFLKQKIVNEIMEI